MIRSFPNIVKQILKGLPTNDYPVLHSCLFCQIWLTFILDKSLTSMRDLFYQLNHSGITVNISTFSKACKKRCDQYFRRIYAELRQKLLRNNPKEARMLFPIDSTVISLTSKLFWLQQYHQVKLLNGINLSQGCPSECLIHFGQGHDARFTDYVMGMIPENGIGIMDRGFESWEFVEELSETNTLFVVNSNLLVLDEVTFASYQGANRGCGSDLFALMFKTGLPIPLPSEVAMSNLSRYISASTSGKGVFNLLILHTLWHNALTHPPLVVLDDMGSLTYGRVQ